MKNFLVFLLRLLISALWLYVVFPIVLVGLGACVWVPLFFEFKGTVVVGIVITILTLIVICIVDHKLASVN